MQSAYFLLTISDNDESNAHAVEQEDEHDHDHEHQDEAMMAKTACDEDEATCSSGQCIERSRLCDGHNDCDDASDELSCQCTHDEIYNYIFSFVSFFLSTYAHF